MTDQPPNSLPAAAAERTRLQRVRRPRLLRRRDQPRPIRRPWVNPWNLANILSSVRVLATIPLVLLVLLNTAAGYFWAFWLFVVVALSDRFDGLLARRYGWVSNIGIFLDLTADKIYTAGLLVAMVQVGILNAWAAIIILVREFVVMGLRSFAAAEGLVIPSGRWGKLKMVVTIMALGWVFVETNIRLGGWFTGLGGWFTWLASLAQPVVWVAVVLTILSGAEYVWGARDIFRQPEAE